MKKIVSKIILLPIASLTVVLFGCQPVSAQGSEVTYREVVLKDFKDNIRSKGESIDDNTSISRSYIFVNGAISFDLSPKPGVYFGTTAKLVLDDLTIEIEHVAMPFVWFGHKIITLKEAFYDYKVYSQENILTIKQMIENGENDFSFLDLPFVEESE